MKLRVQYKEAEGEDKVAHESRLKGWDTTFFDRHQPSLCSRRFLFNSLN